MGFQCLQQLECVCNKPSYIFFIASFSLCPMVGWGLQGWRQFQTELCSQKIVRGGALGRHLFNLHHRKQRRGLWINTKRGQVTGGVLLGIFQIGWLVVFVIVLGILNGFAVVVIDSLLYHNFLEIPFEFLIFFFHKV